MTEYTEPYWYDPRWQAEFIAGVVARGVSPWRADAVLQWFIRRVDEEAARDDAHDGRG